MAGTVEAARRLRNILQFERDKGCADKAVIGGLDALLRNLLAQEPQGDDTSPVLGVVQTLGRRSYAAPTHARSPGWIPTARSRPSIVRS